LRPTPNQPKRNMPMDFAGEQFAAPQPALPKNPFKAQQPRPVQAQPKPFNQGPRPVQSTLPRPAQQTQVRAGEQMRDQLSKQQEQVPIEDVEAKEATGVGENPPDDWLTPKIYKGSTNF